VRASVAFFRAPFVEVRAVLGSIEAAPARVEETVRRAGAAFAKRNGALEEDCGAERVTLAAPISLSGKGAISLEGEDEHPEHSESRADLRAHSEQPVVDNGRADADLRGKPEDLRWQDDVRAATHVVDDRG
jgi:hypothetical protein